MADLLEKIGQYFAAQELQTRQTYAAQYAANQQPNQNQQRVSVVVRVPQRPMKQPPPSLVRRRPSDSAVPGRAGASAIAPQRTETGCKPSASGDKNPRRDLSWGQIFGNNQEDEANAVSRWHASSYAPNELAPPESSGSHSTKSQSRDDEASVSASRKPKRPIQRRKLKRRASVSSQQARSLADEVRLAEQKAEKVAAALALAQERARRIHLEGMQEQQAKQEARDAQRSRIQEQMRRIEAIRIKTKPPATPQSTRPSSVPSITRSLSQRSPMMPRSGPETDEEADATALSTDEEAKAPSQRGFLKSMEETLRNQMLVDLQLKQELVQDQRRKQLEMAKLQAQTLRQTDRNDKQQKTVETLSQNKAALEKELAQLLEQSSALASERRRIEETERQERIRRQKEAERRLNAQLREEEWQRLMEQERTSSEIAAEARAKANQRAISRAAAAKKPTPYCYRTRRSVSASSTSNNREEVRESKGSGSTMWFPAPEISEFEEDGLSETPYEWDFEPVDEDASVSENNGQSPVSIGSFQWQIPAFASKELLDDLLLNDMLSSSDEDV